MTNTNSSEKEFKGKVPSQIAQPWMLREKSKQLAVLSIWMIGDDFEEFTDVQKNSIKMIVFDIASEVGELSSQLEQQDRLLSIEEVAA